MNDEQMQSLLEEEFRTLDTTPKDVQSSTRRVMERKAHVRQRSRWWPFPVFYRRHHAPTATDTTDDRPIPIPAPHGHTPTVIGRTTSMLSPVKAITAGALVFAIGGAFLIAQPFGQQANVPGAETQGIDEIGVVVNATWIGDESAGDRAYVDPFYNVEGMVQDWEWEATDPRLSGAVTLRTHAHDYSAPSYIALEAVEWTVTNDEGSWAGNGHAIISLGGQYGNVGTWVMRGSGGYEGLTAFLTWYSPEDDLDAGGQYWPLAASEQPTFRGVIVADDLPPFPEPAT